MKSELHACPDRSILQSAAHPQLRAMSWLSSQPEAQEGRYGYLSLMGLQLHGLWGHGRSWQESVAFADKVGRERFNKGPRQLLGF